MTQWHIHSWGLIKQGVYWWLGAPGAVYSCRPPIDLKWHMRTDLNLRTQTSVRMCQVAAHTCIEPPTAFHVYRGLYAASETPLKYTAKVYLLQKKEYCFYI